MWVLFSALALLGAGSDQQAAKVVVIPITGEITVTQRAFVKRVERLIRDSAVKPYLVVVKIDTPGGEVMSTLAISNMLLAIGKQGIKTCAYIAPSGEDYDAGTSWSAGALIAMSCHKIFMAPATVIGAAQPVIMTPEGPKTVEGKIVSALKKKFAAVAEENGYPRDIAIAMVDPDYEVFLVKYKGGIQFISGERRASYQNPPDLIETRQLTTKGEPLTLDVNECIEFGIAAPATSISDIYKFYGISSPAETIAVQTWSEDLAGWLTSPAVSSILLLVGLGALYLEFKTPGFGAAGIIGVLSILLVLFGHHLAGLAEVTEILVVILGFAFLAVEIFVFPGFGLPGVLGIICVLVGLVLAMQDFVVPDFGSPIETTAFLNAVTQVFGVFAVSILLFILVVRNVTHLPVLRRLALEQQIAGTPPGTGVLPVLVNATGTAVSSLNPSGKVEIAGQIYDAISDSGFIEKGTGVIVERLTGQIVYVKKAS